MRVPWERWYHLKRWERRSRFQLAAHPLCAMCSEHGVVVPATVADHVVPHKGDEHMFWYGDLQSLCRSHHNASKRQIENVGFTDDIGTDGYPVDPMHPFNQQKQKWMR